MRYKMHYFKTIWNVLDVLILLISYVCSIFNIYRQVKVGQILDELLTDEKTYADFEFLSYWQLQFNNVIAFTVFLAWIKVRRAWHVLVDNLRWLFRSSNMFRSTRR